MRGPGVLVTKDFSIAIVRQAFLNGCSPRADICSHGTIDLVIGGTRITPPDEVYGINESALALLRTLDSDHGADKRVADRLIFHGCGTMLMSGCDIGVDWTVSHSRDEVRLHNVVRFPSNKLDDAVSYSEIDARVQERVYTDEIVNFSKNAKSLFICNEKELTDSWDTEQFGKFWEEYDALLEEHSRPPHAEPGQC